MEQIRRDLYLNRLIERRENGMIKVVTGIRRCGKLNGRRRFPIAGHSPYPHAA